MASKTHPICTFFKVHITPKRRGSGLKVVLEQIKMLKILPQYQFWFTTQIFRIKTLCKFDDIMMTWREEENMHANISQCIHNPGTFLLE